MNARILFASAALAFGLGGVLPMNAMAQSAPAATSELNAIARAQTKLKELGLYNGEITGVMNVATERALNRYQSRNNLTVTGALSPETLSALFRET